MAYEPYKSQTPPGSTGVVNYFESFNKENEQKNRAALGMPQQASQKPLVDWNQMTQGYQPNVEVPNPNKEYIPAPSAPLPNGIQAPSAESAFQQSFPRPKDGIQQAANNAAPAPQLTQPKQSEYLYQQVRTDDNQPTFNADDYKDGTADGLGRNFLKTITEPKTEEDYAKDNETKKRILALGNALRHIGNIVNTSKGAPVQIFNDPVAMQEQKYQTERAKRQSDAYRAAQSQYQQDKLQGDQDYKKFLLNLRMGDLDRQNRRDQAAAERSKRLDEDMKQNRADRLKLQQDQLAYRKENDQANRDLRKELAAQSAALRLQLKSMGGKGKSSSSSGGKGGGKAILAAPDGYFTAKRDLTPTQYKQAWDYLVKNGHITKGYMAKYKAAMSETDRNAIIKNALGYASQRDGTARGDRLRAYLENNMGFGRVYTNGKNQATIHAKSTPAKKAATPSSPKVVKQTKATQKSGGKNSDKEETRQKNNGIGL